MKKIIACMVFVLACSSQQIPKPTPVIPTDTSSCDDGCKHLQTLTDPRDNKLSCMEARPLQLPSGDTESCTDYCVDRQNSGRSLHPSCWITLTSCLDIEKECRWK